MIRPQKNRKEISYFRGALDKKRTLRSMQKYITKKQELDKALEKLLAPILKSDASSVLDVCCGIGHLIYHLHEKFPHVQFLGIDETPYLVKEAKQLLKGAKNVRFEIGDLYNLPRTHRKAFDTTICWKTLTWLPSYEHALRAMLAATRKHIFVSSLFYEGNIDYEIRVREYEKERGAAGEKTYHNIYSLPRFKRFAKSLGAKRVSVYDFSIGIDLPRGPVDHMGTYTLTLKNNTRLQMSGALPMPWKIIHIEL